MPRQVTLGIVDVTSGGELIEKTITENGVYVATDDGADGYSKVTVDVAGGGDVPALNPMLHVMVNCILDQQWVDPSYGALVVNAYIGDDPVCSCAVISDDNGPFIGVPGGCKIEAIPTLDAVTLDTVTCSALDWDDETVETYPSDSDGYIQLPDAMPAGAAKLIVLVHGHSEEGGGGVV